jgi:hypothetical protein
VPVTLSFTSWTTFLDDFSPVDEPQVTEKHPMSMADAGSFRLPILKAVDIMMLDDLSDFFHLSTIFLNIDYATNNDSFPADEYVSKHDFFSIVDFVRDQRLRSAGDPKTSGTRSDSACSTSSCTRSTCRSASFVQHHDKYDVSG